MHSKSSLSLPHLPHLIFNYILSAKLKNIEKHFVSQTKFSHFSSFRFCFSVITMRIPPVTLSIIFKCQQVQKLKNIKKLLRLTDVSTMFSNFSSWSYCLGFIFLKFAQSHPSRSSIHNVLVKIEKMQELLRFTRKHGVL